MSDGQLILSGLLLLVVAFVLRRSFSQSKASRKRDPLQEAQAEIHAAENGVASTINNMELRLHDYAREVEGRIETKLVLLDRLLSEFDEKLARAEAVLPQPAPPDPPQQPSPPEAGSLDTCEEQLKIYRLADEGMSIEEIAARTRQPASHVRLVLKMRSDPGGRDAA